MREVRITKAQAGQRLDRFLGKYLPEASSGFLHKMLRKKNIKLNEKKAEGNEKLADGDRIQIYFSEETLDKFTGSQQKKTTEHKELSREQQNLRSQVRLLFASENVLIFHKPAGMLTQNADPKDDSLNDYLLDYCMEKGDVDEQTLKSFRPSVANRLDRNTSGIVLCGITTVGLQTLSLLLKERKLEKNYLCLVKGRVEKNQKIRGYLKKNEIDNRVTLYQKPVEGAVPIETWYQVVSRSEQVSLLKVRLITGKSHQIRAHLASIGYPIFGDGKYGNRSWNDRLRKEKGVKYQMLHSYELKVPEGLTLPLKELEGLHIVDPVPADFARILGAFELQNSSVQTEEE